MYGPIDEAGCIDADMLQSIHLASRFKSPVLGRQSPLLDLFLSLEHTRPQRKQ